MIKVLLFLVYTIHSSTSQYGSTFTDIDFFPELVANEASLTQNKFPSKGLYGYATLCSFRTLSLVAPSPSSQCLVLALSVLVSNTRYPFTMLIPANTTISSTFNKIIRKLNIQIYRYKEIPIPPAGQAFHRGKSSWLISYQRVHMFRLPFLKVAFLDYDMIITKNIDALFADALSSDMIGSDCTPHITSPPGERSMLRSGHHRAKIGSIEVVTPGEDKFLLFYDLIQNGTVVNATGHAVGWRWEQTDQTLLPATLEMQLLDCKYQIFPDVCFTATSPPLQHFPLRNFSILHFTWSRMKGPDFVRAESFLWLLRKFAIMEQNRHSKQPFDSPNVLIQRIPTSELEARYVSDIITLITLYANYLLQWYDRNVWRSSDLLFTIFTELC